MAIDASVRAEFVEAIGPDSILDDPELTVRYTRDWTGRYEGPSTTVLRPASTEEVVAIVRICAEHAIAVVPQGGNTGLVGGSVPMGGSVGRGAQNASGPLSGEVVLSTDRMVEMRVDSTGAGTVTAGAGVTIAAVQDAAAGIGRTYGVDLASRDSATVGGTIATNAGGLRVARYGATREQLVGVEMVDGAGRVVGHMTGTVRDNTGYHLPSLITGGEGTLGVVTRAMLRLQPLLPHRTTALVRFADHDDAARCAAGLHGVAPQIESVELFFDDGLELVCSVFDLPKPFADSAGGYVLVEAADTTDPTSTLAEIIESVDRVGDVAVAEDPASARRLWRYRELHTEAISTVGTPHKLDVAVPLGALAEFTRRVREVIHDIDPTARLWLFGHGGEAAIHVNVVGPANDSTALDEAVLRLVADMGGSISAEHGIGRSKLPWIGLAHSSADLEVFTGIKAAFDPVGIMNPGVMMPTGMLPGGQSA